MKSEQVKKVDVSALMSRIRKEISEEVDKGESQPTLPQPVDSTGEGSAMSSSVSPLLYSEELNFLNKNWGNWTQQAEITSHRKFIGPLIVKLKRALVKVVWNYALKDYFEAEKKFQMNLVRHLNANARYTDARIKEAFWQLIEKVDNDIEGLNRRTDDLVSISDRTASGVHDEIFSVLNQLKGKVSALESVVSETGDSLAVTEKNGISKKKLVPLVESEHLPLEWRESIRELNSLVKQINSSLESGSS